MVPIDDLPDDLQDLVSEMLSVEVGNRPSIDRVIEELQKISET
jgi:hypothetical protein